MFSRILKEISYNRELKKCKAPTFPIIEKAKWKNFTDSPVNLMVDDLTNAWFDSNQNGTLDLGEDWGAKSGEHNSAINFLENNLLNKYPHAVLTFFIVMGGISSFSKKYSFTKADQFDANETFAKNFLELIQRHKNEIAYHGYNHGFVGTDGDFVQEWKGFKDIGSACCQIKQGQEIYEKFFGYPAKGGKYGGYDYNDFADQSIDQTGFLWWCRDWTPRSISKTVHSDIYELKFFGDNMVVDIPSTVHGRKWTKKQIDILLRHKQIISIQEHVAKYRPHTKGIQYPNIIDDMTSLLKLYEYLQNKNVWHATMTEIAKYFISWSFTHIYNITKDSFDVYFYGGIDDPNLTIKIIKAVSSNIVKDIIVVSPDGISVEPDKIFPGIKTDQYIFNIPIKRGKYRIIPFVSLGMGK